VSLDTGKTFIPFQGLDITAIIDKGQGSYLYIAKDTVTGCMDTTVANVGVSTNLMANISVDNPGCAEDDGTITFNVSGGIVPFEVDIIDSLGNVTSKSGTGFFQFMDLTAGSYFYTIREQSGCTIVASDSIELLVDCTSGCTSLIASAHSFEDATCASDPNGTAIVDVTGGSSPYEYTTDGVNWIPFISGNVIDQLPPNGIYNIVVRQDTLNASCRAEVSVEIYGPEPIVLETPIITTQRASCNQNDGAVKIGRVVGGTGAYNYQIDGTFFELASDSIIMDLGAGMHTFSVIDASSCREDFVFEVESPGVIVATATDVPVSCTSIFLKAGIRIEMDLAATTLPGPYEAYVASTSDPDNGTVYQIPDNGIRTILNLDKDFYIVTIRSGVDGGCNYSETISVFSGAYPLDFDVIDSDSIVSCIGDIGSITIGNVIGDPDTTFIVQLISEGDIILETYKLRWFELEGGFTIDESNTDKLIAGKYYIKMIQNQNE
ncbi:MAG: SprB repeat-containing protein, partial [Cyclobacteriaceae bacterium]|nr:SprB repeat-containing protein [Cyclobacteriaceae bacterium]